MLFLHLILALLARIDIRPIRVGFQRMRTLPKTLQPLPRLFVQLVCLVAETDTLRRPIKREQERMCERLLRVPQSLFTSQTERLVSPRQARVVQEILSRDVGGNVVCPWKDLGHDVFPCERDRADDGVRRVEVF